MIIKVHTKNEAFNADRENWMNARAFNAFSKSASNKYTILAFDKRLYKVLADFDDAVKYFTYGDNGAIIPFLSKQGVEDLSEELTDKGIEHCVFKQTLEIA